MYSCHVGRRLYRLIFLAVASYTRESGVRTLERRIGALCRAVAIRVAETKGETNADGDTSLIPALPVVIDGNALRDILGPPRSFPEEIPTSDEMRPGVALGLAWTPVGGALMFVEASRVGADSEDKLILTGQLGEVMKESATLARTWVRSHSLTLGLDPVACKDGLHLHFPAGATSKDGPSAGVAIVTSLVSLLLGKPARNNTAMTGEITLRGLVLPVGGIKEKLLAAVRAGVKRVILPKKNRVDVEEVPKSAKDVLTIIYASSIDDVIREAFPKVGTSRGQEINLRSKL